jgi:hypothetical protein
MLVVIMLSVAFSYCYAECRYSEGRGAQKTTAQPWNQRYKAFSDAEDKLECLSLTSLIFARMDWSLPMRWGALHYSAPLDWASA